MLKLAFIGPESSGKTTLSTLAAEKFEGNYIEEASRNYLANTNGAYEFEDLEKIARLQFKSIEAYKAELAFIDTDLIDMKVWSIYKYGNCASYIQEHISLQKIDHYFLCKPDFPWVADPLRENPSNKNRAELYALFIQVLNEFKFPFTELIGPISERIAVVESLINTLKKK